MAKNIYGLLVGINDYLPNVGRLSGCVNDVDQFQGYLSENFDKNALRIEVLKDSDATRSNIIDQFRNHLCQATNDDVVVFQYCGHGARSKSAKEFLTYFPDGKDEGLVCYDSRQPGGYDLADKELAVLLAEVARNQPHIAVILDCCHSGSATRSADDFTHIKSRQTHEVFEERPLESYLDSYYTQLHRVGDVLEIPASQHIALTACQRIQQAWETKNHSGVFTSSLLEVLAKTGTDISYADLFERCRAAVHKRADNQDPQFETYRGFQAYSGFLGGEASQKARRYSVYFSDNVWQVDCGALHGLPSDPDKPVELALYPESNRSHLVGHAAVTQVGSQKSLMELLDVEVDQSARYQAEITSLPVPLLAVYIHGDTEGLESLQHFLSISEDRSYGVFLLTDTPNAARYTLIAENQGYRLKQQRTGKLIQGADGYTQVVAEHLFTILKRIATWERVLELHNHASKIDPNDVQFRFSEILDNDNQLHEYTNNHITIDIGKENDGWKVVRGTLKAVHRLQQPVHLLLVHFSEDYGFQPLYNERIEPTESEFVVTLDGEAFFNLSLDEHEGDKATHTFKLIVSTEKMDDFLIGQEPLELGKVATPSRTRGLRLGQERKKLVHENEWLTKDIHVKLVRQVDRVTDTDVMLSDRKITIKGHPSLQAGISLSTPENATRSAGMGVDIYRVLQRQGMEMMNFSSTRGDNGSILELTGIKNAETLAEHPLDIELDIALAEDEYILPLTFDGEHILLAGDLSRDDAGVTNISISQIPDLQDNRRSLGKALKLYFFKTYLKREHINQLCWVEYHQDGSTERHADGVNERVKAAKTVLLLMHGIIGDTQGIAEGLPSTPDATGVNIHEKFDLVLTYDYENLSTPIAETAMALKSRLRDVGIDEHDNKQLTVLVHSMGGLVARWFIEREGGDKVIDHLVMCGTPNVGSPFGKIDSARTVSQALTTMAINAYPAFAPFGGAMIYALNRTRKITPSLEQMNPSSEFIKTLNASDDPAVRYTLIAGDTRNFQEGSDGIAATLLAKLGGGVVFDTLYQSAAHDIAVSVDSILGLPDNRIPAVVKHTVVGHHLNYFLNEASLQTLATIEW